jgi:HSP20 family molecular chaperone IbpA
MTGVRQAMDRLMNEAFSPGHFGTMWSLSAADRERSLLSMDVYATDDEVVILAAAPGVSADDIEITVEKNTVTISGTVPNVAKSEDAQGATWYVHELPSGTFRRSLTVPAEVDAARTEATFNGGILRLVLPKAETSRPRQIPVKGGSQPEPVAIEEEAAPAE